MMVTGFNGITTSDDDQHAVATSPAKVRSSGLQTLLTGRKKGRKRRREEDTKGTEESPNTSLDYSSLKLEKVFEVEESFKASLLDDCDVGILEEYEVELEQIDQQLLELGPFAVGAYVKKEEPVTAREHEVQPLATAVGSSMKRRGRSKTTNQPKGVKQSPKVSDELESPSIQHPTKKEEVESGKDGGGKSEESEGRRDTGRDHGKGKKEQGLTHQKKRWRKLGSGGGKRQKGKDGIREEGADGQTDAHFLDSPLASGPHGGASSLSIIPAASEMEMLSLYLPDFVANSPSSSDIQNTGSAPSSVDGGLLSPQNLELGTNLSQSTSSLASDHGERGEAAPKQHRRSPASPPHAVAVSRSRSQTNLMVSTSEARHTSSHCPLPPPPSSSLSSVTGPSELTSEARPTQPQQGRDASIKEVEQDQVTLPEEKNSQEQAPSPVLKSQPSVPVAHGHHIPFSRGLAGTTPEFSISQLTSPRGLGSGIPTSTSAVQAEETRSQGWHSPLPSSAHYVDVESPIPMSITRKRSSSSSSHRSTKQQSVDDSAILAKRGSPLPPPRAPSVSHVPQGEWSSTSTPSPAPFHGQENRLPGTPPSLPGGASEGVRFHPGATNPYMLWAATGQVPTESSVGVASAATNTLPRYPYPSPFLHSNWLQARGVLGTVTPFRPMFASLDPNNPYKSMFGLSPLSYHYPFPAAAAQGLKSPFPFTTPLTQGSSPPSQVSATFPINQPAVYQLPSSPSLSAFRTLSEPSSRSATPPMMQPPTPFGPIKDDNFPPGGPSENGPDKPPAVQWLNPSLIAPGMPYPFGPTPFALTPPQPLPHSSIAGSPQPPGMNLLGARLGSTALYSSPLTLSGQTHTSLASSEKSALHAVRKSHRRSSSATSSELAAALREPLTQPPDASPSMPVFNLGQMEAAKAAAAASGISQPQFFMGTDMRDPSKWKTMQDVTSQVPSTTNPSVVPPYFVSTGLSNSSSAPMQFTVFTSSSDPRPHMVATTQPQVPTHMSFVGGQLIPVGFAAAQGSPGRGELVGGGGGGRGNAKASPEKMKLRIHQMKNDDFKTQGRGGHRGRRRPWRSREKQMEEKVIATKASPMLRRQSASLSPTGKEAPVTQSVGASEMHGLNILAACSSNLQTTVRGTKVTSPPPTAATLEASRSAKMRSPISLAGANTLLLLGKDVQIHSEDQPQVTGTKPPLQGQSQGGMETALSRVNHAESSVVDSLLQLSSAIPAHMPVTLPTSLGEKIERKDSHLGPHNGRVGEGGETVGHTSRTASFSAAETMLMFGQGVENKSSVEQSVRSSVPVTQIGALEIPDTLKLETRSVRKASEDSEATNTDSEATLSPESPPTSPQWMLEPRTGHQHETKPAPVAEMGLRLDGVPARSEPSDFRSVDGKGSPPLQQTPEVTPPVTAEGPQFHVDVPSSEAFPQEQKTRGVHEEASEELAGKPAQGEVKLTEPVLEAVQDDTVRELQAPDEENGGNRAEYGLPNPAAENRGVGCSQLSAERDTPPSPCTGMGRDEECAMTEEVKDTTPSEPIKSTEVDSQVEEDGSRNEALPSASPLTPSCISPPVSRGTELVQQIVASEEEDTEVQENDAEENVPPAKRLKLLVDTEAGVDVGSESNQVSHSSPDAQDTHGPLSPPEETVKGGEEVKVAECKPLADVLPPLRNLPDTQSPKEAEECSKGGTEFTVEVRSPDDKREQPPLEHIVPCGEDASSVSCGPLPSPPLDKPETHLSSWSKFASRVLEPVSPHTVAEEPTPDTTLSKPGTPESIDPKAELSHSIPPSYVNLDSIPPTDSLVSNANSTELAPMTVLPTSTTDIEESRLSKSTEPSLLPKAMSPSQALLEDGRNREGSSPIPEKSPKYNMDDRRECQIVNTDSLVRPPLSAVAASPVAPQNRLPVGRPGFDRYQHKRLLKKHGGGKDLKPEERKKRVRPSPQEVAGPWPKGLFEVDPQEMRGREAGEKSRSAANVDRLPPPPSLLLPQPPTRGDREERSTDRGPRKTKPSSATHPSQGYQSLSGLQKASGERRSFHPRSYTPDETQLHRHSKEDVRVQPDGRPQPRDPKKIRGRPARQEGSGNLAPANRFDQQGYPPREREREDREREEFSPLSDSEGSSKHTSYSEPHKKWPGEDLREQRGNSNSSRYGSKQKGGHRFEPKKQRSPDFETPVVRKEWKSERSGSSRGSTPERRKYEKTPVGAETPSGTSLAYKSRKRSREEDSGASEVSRKKSYESISEDELVFDNNVRHPWEERRGSHESLLEPKPTSSSGPKERRRKLSSSGSSGEEDLQPMKPRHKKHKHNKDKWRHKEHKKWGSADDKYNSRHSYRK